MLVQNFFPERTRQLTSDTFIQCINAYKKYRPETSQVDIFLQFLYKYKKYTLIYLYKNLSTWDTDLSKFYTARINVYKIRYANRFIRVSGGTQYHFTTFYVYSLQCCIFILYSSLHTGQSAGSRESWMICTEVVRLNLKA